MARMVAVFGLLLAGTGLLVSRLPHLQLAVQLMSHEIDGRSIPVSDYVPEEFAGPTMALRCGELTARVPRDAEVEPTAADATLAVVVKLPDLTCWLAAPRRHVQDADQLEAYAIGYESGQDEMDGIVEICRASGRDLSLWHRAEEIELLQRKLEVRPAFCAGAERVEVVRGRTMSGLLLMQRVENMPRLTFRYVSTDGRIEGTAFFYPQSDSPDAIHAARAMVGALAVSPAEEMLSNSDQPRVLE